MSVSVHDHYSVSLRELPRYSRRSEVQTMGSTWKRPPPVCRTRNDGYPRANRPLSRGSQRSFPRNPLSRGDAMVSAGNGSPPTSSVRRSRLSIDRDNESGLSPGSGSSIVTDISPASPYYYRASSRATSGSRPSRRSRLHRRGSRGLPDGKSASYAISDLGRCHGPRRYRSAPMQFPSNGSSRRQADECMLSPYMKRRRLDESPRTTTNSPCEEGERSKLRSDCSAAYRNPAENRLPSHRYRSPDRSLVKTIPRSPRCSDQYLPRSPIYEPQRIHPRYGSRKVTPFETDRRLKRSRPLAPRDSQLCSSSIGQGGRMPNIPRSAHAYGTQSRETRWVERAGRSPESLPHRRRESCQRSESLREAGRRPSRREGETRYPPSAHSHRGSRASRDHMSTLQEDRGGRSVRSRRGRSPASEEYSSRSGRRTRAPSGYTSRQYSRQKNRPTPSRIHRRRRRPTGGGGERRGVHYHDRRDEGRSYKQSTKQSVSSMKSSFGSKQKRSSDDTAEKKRHRDKIVHFQWAPGQVLNGRYCLTKQLGEGTFGRVLEAQDRLDDDRPVAIKVVRDVPRYSRAAKVEASILSTIKARDPSRQSGNVHFHECFVHEDRHVCLVFESLGLSLYDFISGNLYLGLYMEDIQAIALQCLKTLAFFKELRLTHTDLKPENILLVDDTTSSVPIHRCTAESDDPDATMMRRPNTNKVRIIDFGSATFEDEEHCSLINTRQYRAPEVILNIGWSMASDMWCLGCVLIELYTGALFFKTHEHLEHLHMIKKACGFFPSHMLRKAADNEEGRNLVTRHPVTGRYSLREITSSTSRANYSAADRLDDVVLPCHALFKDFLFSILKIDPDKRPTPKQAMEHDFFKYVIAEGMENWQPNQQLPRSNIRLTVLGREELPGKSPRSGRRKDRREEICVSSSSRAASDRIIIKDP